MAEGLTKKRQIRAGHRRSVTKMLRQVDDLTASIAPDTRADMARLSQLKLSLQEKLGTLQRLDGEILELVEGDEGLFSEEIERADTFKEGIYAAMVRIEKVCATPPAATLSAPSTPTIINSPVPHVRLPKLSIRPFNGDITIG